ncbi:hypothetical protein DXA36_15055 [Eisenbergiella sp. OF01-20]|nr:hypothetical protein DXA36_15055 [Eisenbergiella sp. OF01-20]
MHDISAPFRLVVSVYDNYIYPFLGKSTRHRIISYNLFFFHIRRGAGGRLNGYRPRARAKKYFTSGSK